MNRFGQFREQCNRAVQQLLTVEALGKKPLTAKEKRRKKLDDLLSSEKKWKNLQ